MRGSGLKSIRIRRSIIHIRRTPRVSTTRNHLDQKFDSRTERVQLVANTALWLLAYVWDDFTRNTVTGFFFQSLFHAAPIYAILSLMAHSY